MLNKDEILKRTNNGLSIFKHYVNCEWRLGRNFFNPFYKDSKASCNIYFDRKSGTYRMKDFGNDDYSGDCFFLAGKLNGLDCSIASDFIRILRIINHDLSLGISEMSGDSMPISRSKFTITPQKMIEKSSTPYTIKEQPIRECEKQYWMEYGINQRVLDRYNVRSLTEFSSTNAEGKHYTIKSNSNEPIFGYVNEQFVKIYRPFSSIRFLYGGKMDSCYCFGLEQLPSKGDIVFITGGEKDVLSLAAKGFNAVCFNSETATIPVNIIHSLFHRFKHIVVLYDMDKTGISSSNKLVKEFSSYGVKRMELPLSGDKSEKDISDYFKIGYAKKDFINLFLALLDSLYSTTMTMLRSCELDYSNPPKQADKIISVANVPLGTEGNILCVTGGEGTGKSNYVASLLAGSIKDEHSEIDTLGMTISTNTSHKAVLLYDTEQSEVQLYKNVSNLLRRAKQKTTPEEFKAFCLTSLSRKERLNAIIQSMDRYYYEYGGIHIVVIDGVADLVRCANDEAESIAVVDELYRLAGIYNTCIVTVLHFVPNGLKLRGHLGSEIQRKAAAILSIEKDKDPQISVVKALKVRDGSPLDVPLMQFSWDKEKKMHAYIGEKTHEAKEERKKHDLKKLTNEIFSIHTHIAYSDLCKQIQEMVDVSESTSKNYIKFMRERDLIVKDMYNQSLYTKGV